MKKDSNRNNLIQKQLKIITKKEEKLLKEPNDNYIKTNFDNKSEYKEFLDKIKNKSIYKSDINVD